MFGRRGFGGGGERSTLNTINPGKGVGRNARPPDPRGKKP